MYMKLPNFDLKENDIRHGIDINGSPLFLSCFFFGLYALMCLFQRVIYISRYISTFNMCLSAESNHGQERFVHRE